MALIHRAVCGQEIQIMLILGIPDRGPGSSSEDYRERVIVVGGEVMFGVDCFCRGSRMVSGWVWGACRMEFGCRCLQGYSPNATCRAVWRCDGCHVGLCSVNIGKAYGKGNLDGPILLSLYQPSAYKEALNQHSRVHKITCS